MLSREAPSGRKAARPGSVARASGADDRDVATDSEADDREESGERWGRGAGRGRPKREKQGRSGARGRTRRHSSDADVPDAADDDGNSTDDVTPGGEPPADPEALARAICLRLLTGRARTRAQLADALRRREVPDDVAEHVLGRFTDVGLIDDTAFAGAWVNTRHTGKGLARRALARELRQRGVDAVVVDEAVAQLDPEQELETARALVARKLPGTRGLDRDKRIRRLAGMLARKGYGEGLAVRVVRDALDREADAEAQEQAHDDATAWRAWDGPV
ncbi:recombination regulator RecX [Streptomyces sp. SID3343]|nr:recombination regulator RecX [Streptomyces sp. SID3343]